jgi:hypothetical protein
MDRIDKLAEAICMELVAWHETPTGREYSATGWWARIHEGLDRIKASANDAASLRKAVTGLCYTLLDLGPVSLSIAPSIAVLQKIVDELENEEKTTSN